MTKLSRRELIRQIGIAGASAAIAASSSGFQSGLAESASELGTIVVPLDGTWLFRLDPEDAGESHKSYLAARDSSDWARVEVPHTWQVSTESAEYQGIAWYRTGFEAPATWADKTVRIEFEAVTHSARVWLNGQPIGDHLRAGYTTFTFDISSALRPGATNYLVVKVDNSFDQNMLPRGKSFDWTVDGGIIRPVSLLVSPQAYIERVQVDAQPDLAAQRTRLQIHAVVRNAGNSPVRLSFDYRVAEEETGFPLAIVAGATTVDLDPGATQAVPLQSINEPMRLWDFDHPHLYQVAVQIWLNKKPLHSYTDTFGVRKFEAKDGGLFLNGERVRLMGVERMAGSNPDYGMAEPAPWITHDHDDLKELNCVFTRVHWQQDRRVLNYCDRKGILIQEEVPAWGPETFRGMTNDPTPEIMQNGLQQLREMIARDRNHPSIFAWGLSNEVGGQNPPAQAFIKRMGEEARKLDPHRLLTYASNTLQQTPERDVAGLLDFISWNEYYESWFGGNLESVRHNLEEIRRAFPGKPIVISEYGYCECTPERLGGDARRIEILRDHTHVFGEFDCVAGAIFFDYNDYRTHIGDKGIGVLKQRVHGVVDLYGNRKPSFQALRQESSPIETLRLEAESGALKVTLQTRKTIPAYTLSGYRLRWIVFGFGDLPMEEGTTLLPKLAPGEQAAIQVHFQQKNPRQVRVDVLRPTGFSALTAWWQA
jgi:beta-galactosidase